MIAYKGTKNGWDDTLYYEIGKTYILEKYDPELLPSEFNFYKDIADVNYGHRLDNPETIVFEIEIPNDAEMICDDEFGILVNKFKVLRELSKEEIERISKGRIKFNEQGRLLFVKHLDGTIEEFVYGENGNLVVYREIDVDGEEVIKFDNKGNVIERHIIDNDEKYIETVCDPNRFVINYENDNLFENITSNKHNYLLTNNKEISHEHDNDIKKEYNDMIGRFIQIIHPDGPTEKFVYHRNGSLLFYEVDSEVVYKIKIE